MLSVIFEKNGYTCDQIGQIFCGNSQQKEKHFSSTVKLNCCDIFVQTYVLLRGRRFLMKSLYQRSNDEMDKLVFYMNDMPNVIHNQIKFQVLVQYYDRSQNVGEDLFVALRSHYYLNRYDWNRMGFRLKEIQLSSSSHSCSDSVYNQRNQSFFQRY
ncbi:unnamed protein product [Toxocara canis]|uniref:Uncharacterized protein n=1 Tax=Toxocara canis TaxID=6265 RepID=A0A183U281_TOXCA|nr:unnamed protein product [Toxocara canis]